jgi:hypothetical protein
VLLKKRRFKMKQLKSLLSAVSMILLFGCIPVSKEAERRLENRSEPFSVTVFPVNIVFLDKSEHNAELADRIIEFLKKEGLAKGVPSKEDEDYGFERSRNQAKMAENSGRGFIEFVKKRNIETDYALLVEILAGGSVGGVHFYLLEKGGSLASFGLTNSHWEEFKIVKPATREDGCTVAEMMMKRIWGKKEQ